MKARAPLALTPADPQPQPHPARQGHHIPAILVAQPHVSAAPRAVLPERHQDPLPLRPPPCRNPGHLAPPEVTDHCSYQRTTPAAFAGLEKKAGEKVFSPDPSSISLSLHSLRGGSRLTERQGGVRGGNTFPSPTFLP